MGYSMNTKPLYDLFIWTCRIIKCKLWKRPWNLSNLTFCLVEVSTTTAFLADSQIDLFKHLHNLLINQLLCRVALLKIVLLTSNQIQLPCNLNVFWKNFNQFCNVFFMIVVEDNNHPSCSFSPQISWFHFEFILRKSLFYSLMWSHWWALFGWGYSDNYESILWFYHLAYILGFFY